MAAASSISTTPSPARSKLGFVVMILTVLFSLSAGLAFRKRFLGSRLLFFVAVASLIVPSIVTSLGIALEFRLLDDFLKNHATGLDRR